MNGEETGSSMGPQRLEIVHATITTDSTTIWN
jgi:hypothetical protein